MSITIKDLVKINDFVWEIPKSFRQDMRVPARFYTSNKMLDKIFNDRSTEQLINVTTLPSIQKVALAMPDMHEGYGFPIGGVAATLYPDGVISPGGIGYDINCGVRLLKTNLDEEEIKPHLAKLVEAMFREIPSGVGRGGDIKLNPNILNQMLEQGANWAIANGYGEEPDLDNIESNGSLNTARAQVVSDHAKKRGYDQSGTLGAGNHFLEIDRVDQIFDDKTALGFGLFTGQIVVLIHTGSRGLGHQVATDYIRLMTAAMPQYGISVPDRELVCVPLSSSEGKAYFAAMSAAANFAWANRQLITYHIRRIFKKIFNSRADSLPILYDVAHNIAKIEEHKINGVKQKLILHRKGATRAFGPGQPDLPASYRPFGQPVIIPGSMGTASYVLVGTERAMQETFGSTCHGAGRALSRHAALQAARGAEIKKELESKGIYVKTGSLSGLAEEAPLAYKDIHDVVDVVHQTGIATKVVKLKPLAVIKG